jgi:hypothetical protein
LGFGGRRRHLGACGRFCNGTAAAAAQERQAGTFLGSFGAGTRCARATGRALHARDLISCIAGVWLFVSPWILGSPGSAVSWFSGSNGICGALIAIFALAAYYRATPAEELFIGAVALWVFASTWVVGLGEIPAAMAWSNRIAAAMIAFAVLSGVIRPSQQPSQVAARR